jgi:hypothetical protein
MQYRHAIDICPISPLFNIYAVQYSYSLTVKDKLMFGLAYMNIRYKSGYSNAPGLIMGYKRYLWKDFHAEYQLWPAYNAYYETNEKRYYRGFELWNEFRIGYTINFKMLSKPWYVNLQVLAGFGLLPGNKPQSLLNQAKQEPLFVAPIFFVGRRF